MKRQDDDSHSGAVSSRAVTFGAIPHTPPPPLRSFPAHTPLGTALSQSRSLDQTLGPVGSQQSIAANQASGEKSVRRLLDLMMEQISVMPVTSLRFGPLISTVVNQKVLKAEDSGCCKNRAKEVSNNKLARVLLLLLTCGVSMSSCGLNMCVKQLLLRSLPHCVTAPTSRQSLSSLLFSLAVR